MSAATVRCPAPSKATVARLAWLTFDFAEIDTALGNLAETLAALAGEAPACGDAAGKLRHMRHALRCVLTAIDPETR